MIAAKHNDIKIFTSLINYGANVDITNDDGLSVYHFAALSGNLEMSKILFSIKSPDQNPKIPYIFYAVEGGNIDIVKMYLPLTPNIHITKKDGTNLLFTAIESKDYNMFEFIRNLGVKITKSDLDFTLMHYVAKSGNCKIIQSLLDLGLSPNDLTKGGATPVYFAAENGNVDATRLLCQNVKDPKTYINTPTSSQMTPLYVASLNGHTEEVSYLLELGAESIPLDNGATPLYAAALHGHTDIVQLLLANGSNVNAKSINDFVQSW